MFISDTESRLRKKKKTYYQKITESSIPLPLLLLFLCALLTQPGTELWFPAELSSPLTTFLVPEHLIFNSRVHRLETVHAAFELYRNQILLLLSFLVTLMRNKAMLFVAHLYNTVRLRFFASNGALRS